MIRPGIRDESRPDTVGAVSDDGEYASLAMYPFEGLRPAWERLWAGVANRVPWAPRALRWSGEVQHHWVDPSCTVAHACGWPIAAQLHDRAVVGAFALRLPDADGHRYRSVLVGRGEGDRLAANSDDSLSRLDQRTCHDRRRLHGESCSPAPTRRASSAIASGDADMAMIDALTLAHLRRSDLS